MSQEKPPVPEQKYSCHTSLAANEPLWAHATRVDAWICLGYDQAWGSKALLHSSLPSQLKSHLQELEEAVPNARVQFIRQSGGLDSGAIPLFLSRSDPARPWLRRMTLSSYDELLEIDLASMLTSSDPPGPEAPPAFLTCVNGRRDLCCALYGQAVYDAFEAAAPARAWQTTHLGGHRFAATGIVLPYGLHYGRLAPTHAAPIVRLTDEGRILLEQLRGRTGFDEPVQAAEHHLRHRHNLTRIDDLMLVSSESTAPGIWRIRFLLPPLGQELVLEVVQRDRAYEVITTSGKPEPEWVGHYEVMLAT